MNANVNIQTPAVTAFDGFDIAAADPSASPISGVSVKFVDGKYFSFKDEFDVRERNFSMRDRREGWQFLKGGCQPEYLMRATGEPKPPPQPHVDEAEWPLNLAGVPAHPWRYTYFLYLMDVATGEFSTFWTNTAGGGIAVRELNEQIANMRRLRPGALPIVQLRAVEHTYKKRGVTKLRPHFKIAGWTDGGAAAPAQLPGPEPRQNDGTAEAPAAKAATTKSGVTRLKSRAAVKEPSVVEVPYDDDLPF